MNRILTLLVVVLSLISCHTTIKNNNAKTTPSWYNNPKQNNSENLYGVAEGNTIEEATRHALVSAASRLMVSISSESTLIREENNFSANEEIRQKVQQKVNKIDFSNFTISRSKKIGQKFFVEVQIKRIAFINEQKEKLIILEKKIANLNKNSARQNPIQRHNNLTKILALGKELEIISRILAGSGEKIDLKKKLSYINDFESQLNELSNKIEFYFEKNSSKKISKIIRSALNREKIKISSKPNHFNQNQVTIKISTETKFNQIYGSFLVKVRIDFENSINKKILASNSVEVTGSSSIGKKESYYSALKSFEEQIKKDGILQTIGIIKP